MTSIAIVFESRYGQSEKIAKHIADYATRQGHGTYLVRASLATRASLEPHAGIVIVAPVYFAKHRREIARLLRRHREAIADRPCAFVSVSNSAAIASSLEARTNAMRIARATVNDAAIQPRAIVTTGGAIAYPHYGFVLKVMMRLIARQSGLPRDTSRIHELTDWAALDRDLGPFFAAPELAAPASGPRLSRDEATSASA